MHILTEMIRREGISHLATGSLYRAGLQSLRYPDADRALLVTAGLPNTHQRKRCHSSLRTFLMKLLLVSSSASSILSAAH